MLVTISAALYTFLFTFWTEVHGFLFLVQVGQSRKVIFVYKYNVGKDTLVSTDHSASNFLGVLPS